MHFKVVFRLFEPVQYRVRFVLMLVAPEVDVLRLQWHELVFYQVRQILLNGRASILATPHLRRLLIIQAGVADPEAVVVSYHLWSVRPKVCLLGAEVEGLLILTNYVVSLYAAQGTLREWLARVATDSLV